MFKIILYVFQICLTVINNWVNILFWIFISYLLKIFKKNLLNILDEIANQSLNQNKGEFLRASKPFIERTCSNLFKKIANRIAGSSPFDDILPIS